MKNKIINVNSYFVSKGNPRVDIALINILFYFLFILFIGDHQNPRKEFLSHKYRKLSKIYVSCGCIIAQKGNVFLKVIQGPYERFDFYAFLHESLLIF